MDALTGDSHDEALRKIRETDRQLEKMTERKQTLREIMAKGYLEPAVFAKENSEIAAESDALAVRKEQLIKGMNANDRRVAELGELLRYTGGSGMLTEFDEKLVERFIEHITVHSESEVTFHLKCGLNLRERILK